MTALNNYLAKHYWNEAQLTSAAGISVALLDALIGDELVPAPSYVVTESGMVGSFVFGEMAAPGSTPGRYFHPSQLVWIALAHKAIAEGGDARARLEQQFTGNFSAALAALNGSTWRMPDSFDDAGNPLAAGLKVRTDSAWKYFLNGTFGLCVASPVSEANIALKEVLQEKLAHLSENGSKTTYPTEQVAAMHELIDGFDAAAMPFSPVEYALSSRKRLVDDLRVKLGSPPAYCASDSVRDSMRST